MSRETRLEEKDDAIEILHRCSRVDGDFPVCITIRQTGDSIGYTIESDSWNKKGFIRLSTGNGKLTGVQLRTIAAKDQLEALLEDELFDVIKQLAEADEDRFLILTSESALDDPTFDGIRKTIKAMALFCYTEIVERGLKKPGNPDSGT